LESLRVQTSLRPVPDGTDSPANTIIWLLDEAKIAVCSSLGGGIVPRGAPLHLL
jgi:hypothetical protein